MSKPLKILLPFLVIGLCAAQGFANNFLKIGGVAGESTAGGPGWIDVASFQWGVGRGIAQGPACQNTHTINLMRRGRPSPQLTQLCNQHATLPYLTLDLGGQRHLLQNVSFVQCQLQPIGGGNVQESMSLSYGECVTHYTLQKPGGVFHKGEVSGVDYKPQKQDAPNAIIAILIGLRAQPAAMTLYSLNFIGSKGATLVRKAGGEQDALGQAFHARQVIPTLTLTLNNGQKWTFSNVTIGNLNGDGRTERVSLNFASVQGPPAGYQGLEFKIQKEH